MLWKRLELQGLNHRRWRIAIALLLSPFAIYAFASSGWMTKTLGPLAEQGWDFICLAIAMLGLAIRLHISGHGQMAQPGKLLPDGALQTEGFYSLVRHPTFIANFLILLAGSLLLKSLLFIPLMAVAALLYYERLALAKERIMLERYGHEFSEWAARTPLLFAKLSDWKKPSTPFDRRAALQREAVTFAFIGLMFFVLEALEGTTIDGLPFWEWVQKEPHWLGLAVVGGVIFWTQLPRIWAIAVLTVTTLVMGGGAIAKLAFPQAGNQSAAMDALSSGGYVLLLRHASTEGKDGGEIGHVEIGNCSTQRNLSDFGREQAREIGKALRERGIHFAKTITSEYCRTQETAKLVGADPNEQMNELNERKIHLTLVERLIGIYEKDEKFLRPIRNVIRSWHGEGNLLMVSHAPIITNLMRETVKMGEGFVLKPAPNQKDGFVIVGKIALAHGKE